MIAFPFPALIDNTESRLYSLESILSTKAYELLGSNRLPEHTLNITLEGFTFKNEPEPSSTTDTLKYSFSNTSAVYLKNVGLVLKPGRIEGILNISHETAADFKCSLEYSVNYKDSHALVHASCANLSLLDFQDDIDKLKLNQTKFYLSDLARYFKSLLELFDTPPLGENHYSFLKVSTPNEFDLTVKPWVSQLVDKFKQSNVGKKVLVGATTIIDRYTSGAFVLNDVSEKLDEPIVVLLAKDSNDEDITLFNLSVHHDPDRSEDKTYYTLKTIKDLSVWEGLYPATGTPTITATDIGDYISLTELNRTQAEQIYTILLDLL